MVISLAGCSQGGGGPGDPREHVDALGGDLSKEVARIYKSDALESCDKSRLSKIKEIAAELDRRSIEIMAFAKNAPTTSSKYEKITVGSMYYRRMNTPVTPATTGWRADAYGWDELINYYEEIKSTATDSHWVYLNSEVRSILPDDDDRLQYYENPLMRHDAGKWIAPLKTAADACFADLTCVSINVTDPEVIRYLQAGFATAYYWRKLNDVSLTMDQRRQAVEKFKGWLDRDAYRFAFHPNFGIRRDRDTLVVPMSLSADPQFAAFYAQQFEQAWSVDGLKVRVSWEDTIDAFKVMLNQAANSRSYVDRDSKTMNLFLNIWVTTLRHEFGHVIGLPDEYYRSWDANTCTYTQESDDGNVMSNSRLGQILPRHIQTLKEQYGIVPPQMPPMATTP